MIDPLSDLCQALDQLTEWVRPAQFQISAGKDRAIAEALQSVQPLWTKEEIARRCALLRFVGTEREDFFIDGILAIVFEPAEVTQEWCNGTFTVTFTQKFRRVQAVQAANS